MCNINYLFLFWAVTMCLNFGHSNKLDTFWTPNIDCTHTSDPCILFQDICEPHGTCVPQGCNYKCVCQGGFEGSDCLHPPSQTAVSNPSPEPSSNGNGKRLDIIVGNGALNFLDSLLKESTTASKVIDNIETTTAVDVTTLATSTKLPVKSQIQDSLPQSQPLLALEPKSSKTDQSGSGAVNGDRTTTKPVDVVEPKTVTPSTLTTNEEQTLVNSDTKSVTETTTSTILASEPISATTSSNQPEPNASSSTTKALTNTRTTESPKEMTSQATPLTTVVPNDQLQSQQTANLPNKQAFTTVQTIVKETLKPTQVISVVEPKQVATTEPNQPQAQTTADERVTQSPTIVDVTEPQTPKIADVTEQQTPKIADVTEQQTPKIADVTEPQTPEAVPTTEATKVDTPIQPPPTRPTLSQESTLSLISSLVSELKTLTESLPRTLGLTRATQSVQSEITTTQLTTPGVQLEITTTHPTTPNVQSEPLPSNPDFKQEPVQQNVEQDLTTTPATTTSQKTLQVTESKHTTATPVTPDTSTTAVDLITTKPTPPILASSVASKSVEREAAITTPKSNKTIITSTASAITPTIKMASESPTIAKIAKVLDTIKELSEPTTTTVAPIPFQLSSILSAFLSPHFQHGFAPLDTSTTVPVPSQPALPATSETKVSETSTSTTEITSQRTTTLAEPVSTTSIPGSTPGSNSTDDDVLISPAAVKESKSTQDDNKVDKSSKAAKTQIEDSKLNVPRESQHLPISTSTVAPKSLPSSFESQQYQSSESQPPSPLKKAKKHGDPVSKSSGIQPWKTGELSEPKTTEDNNVVPNTVRGHMTRKGKIFKDLIWDTIFALPSAPEFPEPTSQSDDTPVPIVISPYSSLRHVSTTSSTRFQSIKQNVATSTTSSVPEQPIEQQSTTSSLPEQPFEHQSTTPTVPEQPIEQQSTTSSVHEQPFEHQSTTPTVPEQPIEQQSTTSSVHEQPIRILTTTSSVLEHPTSDNPNSDDDKKSSNEDQDDTSPSSTPDSKAIDLDDLTTVRFDLDSFTPDETSPMTSSSLYRQ